MRITPSLPLLPDPLWPGVVAPDRVQTMVQIEMFVIKSVYFDIYTECKLKNNAKLNSLK